MARGEYTESLVTFHPVGYKLVTNSHRASLDKNAVSVLSGVDPKEYGSIGRWPGSLKVTADTTTDSNNAMGDGYIYSSRFVQRRGIREGHIPTTTGTDGWIHDTAKALASNPGLVVGDWVCVQTTTWATNSQSISRIKKIDGVTFTPDLIDIYGKYNISGNITVQRTACFGKGTSSASGLAIVFDSTTCPMEIRVGQQVQVIMLNTHVSGDTSTVSDVKTIKSITYNSGWQVVFTTSLESAHVNQADKCWVLLPQIAKMESAEVICSTSEADLMSLSKGDCSLLTSSTLSGLSNTNPLSFARLDRGLVLTNGTATPKFLNAWDGIDSFGFPKDAPTLTTSLFRISTSTSPIGEITLGVHQYFLRLVDKSVWPNVFSPPIGFTSVTTTSSHQRTHLMLQEFVGLINSTNEGMDRFLRATDYEIWMTPSGSGTFFLANSGHLSQLKRRTSDAYGGIESIGKWGQKVSDTSPWTVSDFSTEFYISISDTALIGREVLDYENDYFKKPMPVGKLCAMYQDILFTSGKTETTYSGINPKIENDNLYYYSRVDKAEPANFPEKNVQQLGVYGDSVKEFLLCGDMMLILTDFGYVTVRRVGSTLSIQEAGILGYGMAYDRACCSLGSHAVWVGQKNVWLFDASNPGYPQDIGWEIADWIESLTTATRVRMGYDPINRLIYLGRIDTITGGECMVYSFDDQSWTKVEDIILDAPFMGTQVEDAGRAAGGSDTHVGLDEVHFYHWSGAYNGSAWKAPHCFRLRKGGKLIRGGFSTSVATTGTLDSSLNAGGTSFTFAGSAGHPAANDGFRGQVVRFSTGLTRVISGSSLGAGPTYTVTITLGTTVTVATGSTWTIGAIPFRLRFPPVRGEQPFFTKIAKGFTTLLDNVTAPQPSNLTVKLLADYRDTPIATGGLTSGTLAISEAVTVTDQQRTCNVETTGKVIEVQVENEMDHCDFSLIYSGLKVTQPGVVETDRSTAV